MQLKFQIRFLGHTGHVSSMALGHRSEVCRQSTCLSPQEVLQGSAGDGGGREGRAVSALVASGSQSRAHSRHSVNAFQMDD